MPRTPPRLRDGGGRLDFAETHQREMTERRNQAALGGVDTICSGEPLRVARPGELGGTETERTNHRLQPLFDEAAHAGIGADPGQDDEFAPAPQPPGEF